MTRRRRLLWIITAIVAVGIGVVAIGAMLLPRWLHGTIERRGSQALAREVGIGTLQLRPSLNPTLVARDVTLANAAWGSEPAMVRIARVEITLQLSSLWAAPIRIEDLEIEGARVLLETDAGGRGNWEIEREPRPEEPEASARPVVVFDHIALRDLELVHRAAGDARSLRLGVVRLDARLEAATEMIALDATGHFNDAPWDVAGSLGTIERLHELRDVEHDLTGHLGPTKIALRGSIREPLVLGDPALELSIEGEDVAASLATVGLRSPLAGPFRLVGRVSPATDGVDLDLTAEHSGVAAAARGRLSAGSKPVAFDAEVRASGPDASVVEAWTGIGGFPPRPFEVAGRIRSDGPGFRIEDLDLRVGGTSVVVNGAIGEPPRCVGTDLVVAASGADMSELSALAHLRLPADRFTARGRFFRRGDALAIEDVEIDAQDLAVRGAGTIGEPPRFLSQDLMFEASGGDLSRLSDLASVDLPRESFAVRGRVIRHGAAIDLDGIEGRLGENSVGLRGGLVAAPRLVGSELRARVEGPDLAQAASLAGVEGLPSVPYEVSGLVRFASEGYEVESVEARAGRISARAQGRLGLRPAEDGTALDAHVQGPELQDLVAWGAPAGLPEDPFTLTGSLRIDRRVFFANHAVAVVGADRAVVDGTLGALPDLSALDVAVELSGPRLADLGRFFPAAGLPVDPYLVTGRFRRVPAGIESHDARITIGGAEVRLDGTLGTGSGLRGTDVRFVAQAPDATLPAALAGIDLPAGPVEVHGRIERTESGILLEEVAGSVGETRVAISGFAGDLPGLAGTDLALEVAGPDLAAVLGPATDLSFAPAAPFEISARITGSADRLVAERLGARLGESEIEGRLALDLADRPFLDADLRSNRLDFSRKPDEPVEETPPRRRDERIISSEPLASLDALRTADARIRLAIAELVMPATSLRDVVIEGDLFDGALRLGRFAGTGQHGGRATASLSLEPHDGAYRLQASGSIANGRLEVGTAAHPEESPSLDLELAIEGSGRSLHEIAASSNGSALITLGPGRISNSLVDTLASGAILGLLDALNPFRRSSPHTGFECGVAAADIQGGKVVVQPIAARTDKLTAVGHGKIDLATEGIDLEWTLKPRQGVGISAGSITNPYIKLGGTLGSPALEAKPIAAVASTGAAVATAGLSLLFRGVYDRVTAEKKVCIDALAKAERQSQARESGPRTARTGANAARDPH